MVVSIFMFKKNVLMYSQRALPEKNILILIFQVTMYFLLGWKSFTPVITNNFLKEIKYNKWIPFSINYKSNKIKEKWNSEELQITTISKLTKRKNVDLVINAVQSLGLSNIRFNIIVVLTNENHRDFYNKHLRKLENKKNIFIYKNISNLKVQTILKKSHIFILLSEKEPASISNLEAMAYGNALILGKDNGTANYLDSNGGFIVNYDMLNVLKALNNLVYSRSELRKMGKYNIQKVQNNFNAKIIAQNFLDYLEI